jgi:ketosteroid isomerase-like protein
MTGGPLLALLPLGAGVLALATGCGGRAADADAIVAAVRDYDAAWNRRDGAGVDAALAPDYAYFSSTGRVVTREETLGFLTSPEYRLEAAERSELRVTHASPEAAVVSSRWRGQGTWEGEAFDDDQRCSLVLRRSGERWQLLAEHCTQITDRDSPPPAPAAVAGCFESDLSPFGRSGPATGGSGPGGWLRLESSARPDSGAARIEDDGGASLRASWRRIAADSVLITGFDDFVRVEYRLALSGGGASGPAVLTSDAELVPDGAGGLRELRREWMFQAAAVSCERLPGGPPRQPPPGTDPQP